MFSPPPRSCAPPRWARGGHAQTVLGSCLPTGRPDPSLVSGFATHSVPLADGGALGVWHACGERDLVVVLMHGLGGSTSAPYMRVAASTAQRLGHPVIAVNHRGSGGAAEDTERPYMTGNTADLRDLLAWTRRRYPGRPVLMVGFSLSGNTLLKWLGEAATDHPEVAFALNPGIDLDLVSRHLLGWPQHGYDLWILRSCRRWIPRLRGAGDARYHVPAFSSLREFDARYIVPVWGFPDRETYYREASSAQALVRIQTPTLLLSSADDPIVPIDLLTGARRSAAVDLHVQDHGGHLGYLESGRGAGLARWLDHALEHYYEQASDLVAGALAPPAPPSRLAPCAP
ncbi:MAG: alpha/beta fold hydrolase [Planctomycetota bacterium]|nr:alpha/beta fold hydrolase [Planctomycetota bacterium]